MNVNEWLFTWKDEDPEGKIQEAFVHILAYNPNPDHLYTHLIQY